MAAVHEPLRIFLVFVTVVALPLRDSVKHSPYVESELSKMMMSHRTDLSKETHDAYQKVVHDLYGWHGKVREEGFAKFIESLPPYQQEELWKNVKAYDDGMRKTFGVWDGRTWVRE